MNRGLRGVAVSFGKEATEDLDLLSEQRLVLDEDELFHIIHKAMWMVNEKRPELEKIQVLDREIGDVVKIIQKELKELFGNQKHKKKINRAHFMLNSL